MRTTFFGDSLTAGECNDFRSFAKFYAEDDKDIEKGILAISGTTIGEYSVYPVDGNSFLSVLYRNKDVVENSDVIVIEYGINDASSLFLGNVTLSQIVVAVAKALDYIKQVNPNAKVYWLKPIQDRALIEEFAKYHVKYLFEDYLTGFRKADDNSALRWADDYEKIYHCISRQTRLIAGISEIPTLKDLFASDNIHFNDEGHKKLARVLEEEILHSEGN